MFLCDCHSHCITISKMHFLSRNVLFYKITHCPPHGDVGHCSYNPQSIAQSAFTLTDILPLLQPAGADCDLFSSNQSEFYFLLLHDYVVSPLVRDFFFPFSPSLSFLIGIEIENHKKIDDALFP